MAENSPEIGAIAQGVGNVKKRALIALVLLAGQIENVQAKRESLEGTVVKSLPLDAELNELRRTQNDLLNIVSELPDAPGESGEVVEEPAAPVSEPTPVAPAVETPAAPARSDGFNRNFRPGRQGSQAPATPAVEAPATPSTENVA